MYNLKIGITHTYDDNYPIIVKLFKEVLGYTDEEIRQFANTMFMCNVVKNVSLEQAEVILKPFNDNDINLYIVNRRNIPVSFREAGINLTKEPPKDHYYDQPVVSRDQLVNPLTQKAIERQEILSQPDSAFYANVPKCPTCGSTNVQRIGTGEKMVSGALWGLFSTKIRKNYKCNSCKYMW